MELNKAASNRWALQPFPGSQLKIGSTGAPCWIHRLLQRAILGFVWTRQKGKQDG